MNKALLFILILLIAVLAYMFLAGRMGQQEEYVYIDTPSMETYEPPVPSYLEEVENAESFRPSASMQMMQSVEVEQ